MPNRVGGNACSVPGCGNNSTANRNVSFYAPKDEAMKRKWAEIIESHNPGDGTRKKPNVTHVCSAHFAEDAYVDSDVLKAKFGMAPRRMRLKVGSVPSIFEDGIVNAHGSHGDESETYSCQEVSEARSCTTQPHSEPGDLCSADTVASTVPGSQINVIHDDSNVVVLDTFPLAPLVPYQAVSQYGFVYTLVPYNVQKFADKATQAAVAVNTQGTQTADCRSSVSTQTALFQHPFGSSSHKSG